MALHAGNRRSAPLRGLVVMMPSVSMSDAAVLPEGAFGGVAVDDTYSETRRAPADRSRGDKRAFASVRSHQSQPGLSGLHEPIGEAIGLALDRGIKHLDRVRIVLVREHGAFRIQYEAGRLHLLANGCRLNPMQRLGVARSHACGGGVVYDDVGPTGLQPLVDSSVEVGRRRAPGLDKRGVG